MSHPVVQGKIKMCKSPKNFNTSTATAPTIKANDKIEYENLSTNCTVVGSNNLNLVKKAVSGMSPAYSNPSPGCYPPPSPYSSPGSLKSPSPSNLIKPPTPQPQHNTFPVVQLIHNSHILARPLPHQPAATNHHHHHHTQNVIKLKPHLNILPKPSASPSQPSPKPSVSPQIVIPANQQATATIMPTAQPVLLNQMPLLTTPGVQFILRPQTTAKMPAQMSTAQPQGLILQQGGQSLLQIPATQRSQPMVRVLTNGVQLAPSTTTTYVTQMAQPQPIQAAQQNLINNAQHHHIQQQQQQQQKQKKNKTSKVKKKLDLANIMKLSGIGDEDDIQFESDASQSESEHTPQPHHHHHQATTHQHIHNLNEVKKMGNIQLSQLAPQTVNQPVAVQVLNQNFQSTSQAATATAFNPFIAAPNFTINNGLMVQRTAGGFKLTLGEDGRLVLQHDPTLNQDLQSQLILQSIFGLNGGLVLQQPPLDQQTHQAVHQQTVHQQTVQTIQQQTVQSQTIQTVQQQTVQPQIQTIQPQQIQQQTVQQTIQHQTVQSQPLQLQQPMQIVQPHQVHHNLQSQIQTLIQQQQQQHVQQQQQQHHGVVHGFQQQQQQSHQPVLKVQPFQKTQPPVQTVHPQPIQQQQQQQQQHHQCNEATAPPPTSYVVNLTPDQLEQLKRNGQLTVNGQTIFMQRPGNNPKQQQAIQQQQQQQQQQQHQIQPMDEPKKLSPKIKAVKKMPKIQAVKNFQNDIKETTTTTTTKSSLVTALQAPPKHVISCHQKSAAIVQPSVVLKEKVIVAKQPVVQVTQQQNQPQQQQPLKVVDNSNGSQDVENLFGQLLDDRGGDVVTSSPVLPTTVAATTTVSKTTTQQQQRIHTIQLTPQKQEHLKNVQMQIQTLTSSVTPANPDIQAALKMLFAEQQKILASGKLLPPDKVYYHNNHITIINPSGLNVGTTAPSTPTVATTNGSTAVVKEQLNVVGSNSSGGDVTRQVGLTSVAARSTVAGDHQVQSVQLLHTSSQTQRLSVAPMIQAQQQQQQQQQQTKVVLQSSQQPCQQQTAQAQSSLIVPPIAIAPAPSVAMTTTSSTTISSGLVQQQSQTHHTAAKKAHLIEAQLNLDQNGAVKPDIHTPFRDKKDACIRLIRYHCLDQPVLSQKDLDKADEIFEMTAKHFIGKYAKMVDKYKYLLMKESMRQVQTSELMMLDRMYLSEERQSLMRLRQEADEAAHMMELHPVPPPAPDPPPLPSHTSSRQHHHHHHHHQHQNEPSSSAVEDYDEWACIQRELGCLPPSQSTTTTITTSSSSSTISSIVHHHNIGGGGLNHTHHPPKRTASTDSRLETLKRFRVDKHTKRSGGGGGDPVMVGVTNQQHHHHNNSIHNPTSNVRNVINNNGCHGNNNNSNNSVVYGSDVLSVVGCQETYNQQQLQHNQQDFHHHSNNSGSDEPEMENNSIDEQVQSAIDSILNLQQTTNTPLDLDSILS